MIISQIIVVNRSLGERIVDGFLTDHSRHLALRSPLRDGWEKREGSCPALSRKLKAEHCYGNMFLPFWGNVTQPNASHFFNTIQGKGRGRLGLIKIGSRCWRRRMGKVVIWSKGERAARCAWAQLERPQVHPQLFCPNLEPHQLVMWRRMAYKYHLQKVRNDL